MKNNCPWQPPEPKQESHPVYDPWKVLLNKQLHCRTQEVVRWVAQRMCDPAYVWQMALQSKEGGFPQPRDFPHPWMAAELALFYHYLARSFPEDNWQAIAQKYLKLVAIGSQRHNLASPALFGGLSGVAFVIAHFSQAGQRYQQTLAHLHSSIAKYVCQRRLWLRPSQMGIAESDFDIIVGASGVIGYLISIPTPDSIVQEPLHTLLNYLLTLTEPGQIPGQERWLSSSRLLVSEHARQQFPYGRFNCGMAHGIAGLQAALSLAAIAGYDDARLRSSLISSSTWLLDHQVHDTWGVAWPVAIPYELASSPEQWRLLPASYTTWCYGAPGIARSLWLAGQALRDDHLMQIALEILKTALQRLIDAHNINDLTLCHGLTGLLLICLRFANESQDTFLLQQLPTLVEQILEQFDPQSLSGFRASKPGGMQMSGSGILTGTLGTALVLLAATTESAPCWDRLLLLS